MSVRLNTSFVGEAADAAKLLAIQPEITAAHEKLHNGTGAGNAFLGWVDLPVNYDKEEFARIKAAGSNTNSCRSTDTARLKKPCPSAWNTEDATTLNPAIKKLRLMIRSAGIPISFIETEALKISSRFPGNNWNTANPASMMHTPYAMLSRIAFVIRSGFLAP